MIKKLTITYGGTTAGSTGFTEYSGDGAWGKIVGITHVPGTVVPPTTSAMTLESKSNGIRFWNSVAIGSTAAFTKIPIAIGYSSTGGAIGASTSYTGYPYWLENEEVKLTLVGATSASVAGSVYVWVDGGD